MDQIEEIQKPRLGKICDFSSSSIDANIESKFERRRTRVQTMSLELSQGLAGALSYVVESETFSVVDRAAAAKKQARKAKPVFKKDVVEDAKKAALKKRAFPERNIKPREMSIAVGQDWALLEEVDHARLMKLTAQGGSPTDLSVNGSCNYYNRAIDKIVTRLFENIVPSEKRVINVSTSDDTIMSSLSESVTEPTLFATDSILATLMCATRSVYSWDIVVTKEDNKIFLDQREGGPLDSLTVNENAVEPPAETLKHDINSPVNLGLEATLVNHHFTQQVLKEGESVKVKGEAPFNSEDSTLYRYRQWSLEGNMNVVVRTQIDAAVEHSNGTSQDISFESSSLPMKNTLLVNIHAVNEYDSKHVAGSSDYRQKIDAQRGAVLATEIKNNGNKIAKWTIQSILSGADQMKLGYISRTSTKDNKKHCILGASTHNPADLATQMNLKMDSAWGVVKAFTEVFSKLPNGKFLLLRDANKPILRLYSVPMNIFDERVVDDIAVDEE